MVNMYVNVMHIKTLRLLKLKFIFGFPNILKLDFALFFLLCSKNEAISGSIGEGVSWRGNFPVIRRK
jgi:hypothetical protein